MFVKYSVRTEVTVATIQHVHFHGPAVSAAGVWISSTSCHGGAGYDEPATGHQVSHDSHIQCQLHFTTSQQTHTHRDQEGVS